MSAHLRNVAAAASRQDRAGATRELDAFATDVAREEAAGHLPKVDYVALETGIGRTRARIGLDIAGPASAVPNSAASAASAAAGGPGVQVTPTVSGVPQALDGGGSSGDAGKVKVDGGGGKHGNGDGNGNGGD